MSVLEKANKLAKKLKHISRAVDDRFVHDELTDEELEFVKNNTFLFNHDSLVAAGL